MFKEVVDPGNNVGLLQVSSLLLHQHPYICILFNFHLPSSGSTTFPVLFFRTYPSHTHFYSTQKDTVRSIVDISNPNSMYNSTKNTHSPKSTRDSRD
jgi:hypothetical protein